MAFCFSKLISESKATVRFVVKRVKKFNVRVGWSEPTGAGYANGAPGLIFGIFDAVAPDVVWVSAERVSEILGDDGKLHGAPELVIEVISPGW